MHNKPYNVVSLFDGISCWMIALLKACISIGKYYSSEIDPDAILVSKYNYPNIIQVGDICSLKGEDFKDIDIVIWGSPCQSFSVAGKQEWFDGKSKLFYEYIRLLKEIKPKYFLLENVKMKKEWQDIITNTLREIYPDTEVYNINSKLVSAQLRNRFYRTNIPGITQPEDKWIKLQDILQSGTTDREKARAILESESRPLVSKDKMWRRYSLTGFTTIVYENSIQDKTNIRYFTQEELERLQTIPNGYTKIVGRNKAAGLIGNWRTVDVLAHIFSFIK